MADNREAYLELLKRSLINELYAAYEFKPVKRNNPLRRGLVASMAKMGYRLTTSQLVSHEDRQNGRIMPPMAHTGVGRKRLDNIHYCIRTIVEDDVRGDVIETGVWRGGAMVFMRGALNAYGQQARTVWAADSFQGLPPPADEHSWDRGAKWHTRDELAISMEEVQALAKRYDLDEGIRYLKGWFKDTLPAAETGPLALARLDGDMYGSTMDALTALYDRVSPGGFLIIDDYHGVEACKAAVDDFRRERGITDPIEDVDWTGAFWRKSGSGVSPE